MLRLTHFRKEQGQTVHIGEVIGNCGKRETDKWTYKQAYILTERRTNRKIKFDTTTILKYNKTTFIEEKCIRNKGNIFILSMMSK